MLACGEVAEWLNAADSKFAMAATSSWVQIPPSPLITDNVETLYIMSKSGFWIKDIMADRRDLISLSFRTRLQGFIEVSAIA